MRKVCSRLMKKASMMSSRAERRADLQLEGLTAIGRSHLLLFVFSNKPQVLRCAPAPEARSGAQDAQDDTHLFISLLA